MSIGLDTSVVLRLLTGVPAKHADAARTMLTASRETICISDLVVSETYFALRHHYAVPHADAAHAMAALLDEFKDDLMVRKMQAQLPTMSVPNWITLLTGAPPEWTGVLGNLLVPETQYATSTSHPSL